MKIGTFVIDKDGVLHGKVYGLGIGAISVIFEPQTSNGGKEYFRLVADPLKEAYEIGVAFPKEKNGTFYHSVSIESPILATPINAALFQDKENSNTYNLVWNRPEPQDRKAKAAVNIQRNSQQPTRFASPRMN